MRSLPIVRAGISLCLAVLSGLVGCQRTEPSKPAVESRALALNANPQTTSFAIYAQNSAALRDRVAVSGGDVGVKVAGTGPFLVSGYELALVSQATVELSHNVIANRVLLQGASVGDVQTNQLTSQNGGTYVHSYTFPATMPALPPLATVTPGTTAVNVATSATKVLASGSYGAVSVANRGVLRLQGGVYHLSSLQLGDDARIEVSAPVQLRISGRLSTLARIFVGAANGVSLVAGDVRIEVSGRNGNSGSLSDSPQAAALGSDSTIRAVMLVPNGTLLTGQRMVMTGAFLAKDVYVDIDSHVTYESGCGPAGCLQSCDDGNPCTVDSCSVGACVHTAASAGTSCADSELCNGSETCDGAGHCQAGTPVTCSPLDQCHVVGACNPATGLCSNPAKPDGTACNDSNSCTKTDVCTSGACAGTAYTCNDGLSCTADTCNGDGTCTYAPNAGSCVIAGACLAAGTANPANECQQCLPSASQTAWSPKADGTGCNDGNACTKNDVCTAGACSGATYTCDDGLACTSDSCNGDGTCTFVPTAGACVIGGACVLAGTTDPANQCQECSPATSQIAWSPKANGTSCNDGNACTKSDSCTAGTCGGTAYTCNDGLACTSDTCNGDGTCTYTPNPSSCVIGGACVAAGTTNAGNQCQECAPAVGQTTWSPKVNGTSCNDGNACTKSDICTAGACGGTTYSCDDGLSCTSDSCNGDGTCTFAPSEGSCAIAGACFAANDTDPANQCQACVPTNNQTAWSAKPTGTSCDDGNACTKSDSCAAGTCGGTAYTCDDGLACTGDVCNGDGTCTSTPNTGSCVIAGTCYAVGDSNPGNQCQACDSSDARNWSNKSDGTACDDGNAQTQGDVCSLGECQGIQTCAAVSAISTGGTHTCAVRSDGSLWCWGANAYGQIGNGGTDSSLSPVRSGSSRWRWTTVTAGQNHTCGLQIDGTMWCWGDNSTGQLGSGGSAQSPDPMRVGTQTWVAVQAGGNHTCAVQSNGTLWCWGDNSHGAVGDGTTVNRSQPVQVDGANWVAVTTGSSHTCAVKGDHGLWCWGQNSDGRLGNGSTDDSSLPMSVGSGSWASTSAGESHSCGVQMDGSLWCWGENLSSQLGTGNTTSSAIPVHVGSASWASISAGGSHSCGTQSDGTLWCWGANLSGQIGDGSNVTRSAPVRVRGRAWVVASAGTGHSCGRRQDGSAWCWGANESGELGDGTSTARQTPEQLVGSLCGQVPICGNSVVEQGEECDDGNNTNGDGCSFECLSEKCHGVVCTPNDQCHDAGVCESTTGLCSNPARADNSPCEDGDPSTLNDTCQAGVCIPGASACPTVQSLESGSLSTCITWTGGHLWCWGYNYYGQLGVGTTTNSYIPKELASGRWNTVNVGSYYACGIKSDGSLWCWGQNTYGQLGIGTSVNKSTPTQVQDTGWAKVALGNGHTCATKSNGSLWCWGYNSSGQLGTGTTANRSLPVQIGGNDWVDVVAGNWHTCARKTDGTLWCWGLNSTGQVGTGGSSSTVLTPAAVAGTGWVSVAAGYGHTCASKDDGTLWCWGYNPFGQLGDGSTSTRSTPGQVSGAGWTKVSAGYGHSCAQRTDGSLWCWGYNQSGQLGDGTTTNHLSPTQVGGTNWTSVSVGSEYTCAVQSGSTLSCWGNNAYGQLGDGSTTSKAMPTPIGRAGCGGACGDSYVDWNEDCDDGNTVAGDGCSPQCQKEVCGNGHLDPGEECDDGNQVSGDGCSGDCRIELCGNGHLDPGEECDDGNHVSGDGCSAMCLLEICGNGRVDAGEECDDGNQNNDDQCSNACKVNKCYGASCSWRNDACNVFSCNPTNGQCEPTHRPDGTACDDSNACTPTDRCQSGQCVGSGQLDCAAKNACQLNGTCDPVKGCVMPNRPDGTACDDGSSCTASDACEGGACVGVVSVACFQSQVTPINPTVPTAVGSSTTFLYDGVNAVQTGVATGTIDPVRASVVRGEVKDRNGAPIGGVKVTINGHSELGQTRTREDGWFDMAVNGGGRLRISCERHGYLRVERNVDAPWQEYSVVPDVVMTPLDPAVTTVDLPTSVLQVARGSAVTDEDGTRQAAVLFPSNVTATMEGPQFNLPLNRLSVRATEYTVGAQGPSAMPAPLPANSGYTYAVELSVDEAIAAGALSVVFSQPVYLYVNNFLNLPVGASAPIGTYDKLANYLSGTDAWTALASGRVVKILQNTAGKAVLAVDGSGLPASAAALTALGITDEELAELGQSYLVGQSLWRVPIQHFSAHDVNLPYGYPHGIEYPQPGSPEQEKPEKCSDTAKGSIIECENQVLGQEIAVAGTPFTLEYRSRATDGDERTKTVSLPVKSISSTAQSLLKEVVVKVAVAGQEIEQRYSKTSYPGSNPRFDFTWSGLDAYGRQAQGAQKTRTTVGFVYPILYRSQADLDIIFGEWATPPATIISRSAATATLLGDASSTAGTRGSPQITLGGLRAPIGELGGWTLSVHHTYDPQMRVLYRGDGRFQTADDVKQVVKAIAGNGNTVTDGQFNSGPALKVPLDFLYGTRATMTTAPSGDLLFSDRNYFGKVDSSGYLTRFGYEGWWPNVDCLTLGYDGAAYFTAHTGAHEGAVGVVEPPYGLTALRVTTSYTMAPNQAIWALAPGPDGSVYAVPGPTYPTPTDKYRVVKRTPDGKLRQVAGTSSAGYSPDGTPAAQAQLTISDIAVGPDGSLFISEGVRIRRIGADGLLTTVAGTGVSGYSGDGGPATQAKISASHLRIGADGTVYLASDTTIRHIAADGTIFTLVGNGQTGTIIDGASARASLSVSAFSLAADGSVLFTDAPSGGSGQHIWRVSPPLPGFEAKDTVIASDDGSELYVFDASGRHLRTQQALTGALVYTFSYTADGKLSTVVDRDSLVTRIERDTTGSPTAIVAPNGQRTPLSLDASGYLASITDPGGNGNNFTYTADGLMTELRDPKQNLHTFEYDQSGRLKKDNAPEGVFTTLSRDGTPASYNVTKASAEGRSTKYHVEAFTDGSSREQTTDATGLTSTRTTNVSGVVSRTTPDGMVRSSTIAPDPRLGMQAPLPASTVMTTPAGKQMTISMSRTVTTDTDPQQSLLAQVDVTKINGKAFTTTYNASAKTLTSVSPVGRQTVTTLDAKGRVAQVQTGKLSPTAYAYAARGQLQTVTVGTGSTARLTTFGYDDFDRLSTVTDPSNRVQQYIYDDANRVVGQTFADQRTVAFGYDANGNVTSVTPPGRPAHGFAFTPNELMSSYTPPTVDGTAVTTYEYNLDMQPTVIHRPDGSTINFTYDSAGRLAMTTYPSVGGNVTVTRTYDPTTGNLSGVTTSEGQSLAYGYDGSLPTSTTWSGNVAGSVSRTYNNDFRVATESVNGANSVAFGYDNDGLLTSVDGLSITRDPANGFISDTTLGSVTDHRTYDGYGLVATYEAKFGTTSLYSTAYVRDSLGRIGQKTETIQGTTTVWNYSYDQAGRLWQVMQNGTVTATYLYDANGNRTSKTTPSGTESGTYDAQDRLLTYGKWSYTYTANGDLQGKTDTNTGQVTNYSYDAQGNLRHVSLPDGRSVDYSVDAQNRRVAKKINGTVVRKWIYKTPLRPVAEFDGSGTLLSRYLDGVTMKGGTSYRVVADHMGAPRLLVNSATGAVGQRLDFDEWGQVIADSSVGFQVFGFAGGIYDPDTGLVRFGARDYDPVVGRWTARDPSLFGGGQANLFAYSLNDPVNWRDSNGRIPVVIAAVGVGLAIGYAIGAAEQIGNAIGDFLANYQDMKQLNYIGADQYFHCMANCQASNRGPAGEATAKLMSEAREVTDWMRDPESKDPDANGKGGYRSITVDCNSDRYANAVGQQGGDCEQRCQEFRPRGF